MNAWALAFLIGLGAAAVIEGIVLLGRIRQFLDYAKQLTEIGAQHVAAIPSKSAPRDVEPLTRPIPTPEPYGRHAARRPQPGGRRP